MAVVNVRGYKGLTHIVKNLGDYSSRYSRQLMDKYVDRIVELAKKLAPEDSGSLADAISVENGVDRSRHGRKTKKIYIDKDKLNTGKSRGFNYATKMHNGEYKLGEKSAKKTAPFGLSIGQKYIKQAADFYLPEFQEKMATELKKELKRRSSR